MQVAFKFWSYISFLRPLYKSLKMMKLFVHRLLLDFTHFFFLYASEISVHVDLSSVENIEADEGCLEFQSVINKKYFTGMEADCTADNLSKLDAERNVCPTPPPLTLCVCACSCGGECSDQEHSMLFRPSKWYHRNPLL